MGANHNTNRQISIRPHSKNSCLSGGGLVHSPRVSRYPHKSDCRTLSNSPNIDAYAFNLSFDPDRRRRFLSITNQAEPLVCRLLGWSYRRGSLVTISRFHGEVRLMNADSNLTALATFISCCFRIIANAVLPTQFLRNSRERFGQLRRVISLIKPATALVCQGVQILIGSVVISLGCSRKRNASVDWRTIDRLCGRPRAKWPITASRNNCDVPAAGVLIRAHVISRVVPNWIN